MTLKSTQEAKYPFELHTKEASHSLSKTSVCYHDEPFFIQIMVLIGYTTTLLVLLLKSYVFFFGTCCAELIIS